MGEHSDPLGRNRQNFFVSAQNRECFSAIIYYYQCSCPLGPICPLGPLGNLGALSPIGPFGLFTLFCPFGPLGPILRYCTLRYSKVCTFLGRLGRFGPLGPLCHTCTF
jgi:hypothetical protein